MKTKIYITHKKGDANGEGFAFLTSTLIPALVCEWPFDWAPNGYTGKTCRAVLAVDVTGEDLCAEHLSNIPAILLNALCDWLHPEYRDDARRLLEVSTTIPDDTDGED